ncbi:MAG TPA: hypothetical protein VEZ55_06190 [Chitinophagaceae bacterium]|nr:hypothetical protein [Chitinophagaceae bacterium]
MHDPKFFNGSSAAVTRWGRKAGKEVSSKQFTEIFLNVVERIFCTKPLAA